MTGFLAPERLDSEPAGSKNREDQQSHPQSRIEKCRRIVLFSDTNIEFAPHTNENVYKSESY